MKLFKHHSDEGFAVKEQVFRQTFSGNEAETFFGKLLYGTSHFFGIVILLSTKNKVEIDFLNNTFFVASILAYLDFFVNTKNACPNFKSVYKGLGDFVWV